MIRPGLGGAKPYHGVAAGKHVLLDAKCWNEQAVNHVLRGHDEFYVAADWHVQLIQFHLPGHVLELPHPLLGDGVNGVCVARRSVRLVVDHCAPGKNHQENPHGNDGPGGLQYPGTMDLDSFVSRTPAVLKRKHEDGDKDRDRHEYRERHQEKVERINRPGLGGSGRRPKWKVLKHNFYLLSSVMRSGSSPLNPAGTSPG